MAAWLFSTLYAGSFGLMTISLAGNTSAGVSGFGSAVRDVMSRGTVVGVGATAARASVPLRSSCTIIQDPSPQTVSSAMAPSPPSST